MQTSKKKVIFITGASGVGKTTIVNRLKEELASKPEVNLFNFDDIGVPSLEEMEKEYGSGPEWQRQTTNTWVHKILNNPNLETVILEGQVNLDFIFEAFDTHDFQNYEIILIDCDTNDMITRLQERGQPELATQEMENWMQHLRSQAQEYSATVINTSTLSLPEVVEQLKQEITS